MERGLNNFSYWEFYMHSDTFKQILAVTMTTIIGTSAWAQQLGNVSQPETMISLPGLPGLDPKMPTLDAVQKKLGSLKKEVHPQGPGSSGGGSFVVLPAGDKVLLDFYSFGSNLRNLSLVPGYKIPTTESYRKYGIGYLEISNPIHTRAFEIVKDWESSAPKLSRILIRSLNTTPFLFMKYDFGFKDPNQFVPDAVEKNANIQTGAYFVDGKGVMLSKPFFDSLSEDNQVGLVIHEALRKIQIGYGKYLSNKDIQEITAVLMLSRPSSKFSLDERLDMSSEGYLNSEIARAIETTCRAKKKLNLSGKVKCLDIKQVEALSDLRGRVLVVLDAIGTATGEIIERSKDSNLSYIERGDLRSEARLLNDQAGRLISTGTEAIFTESTEPVFVIKDSLDAFNMQAFVEELYSPSENMAYSVGKIFRDLKDKGVLR